MKRNKLKLITKILAITIICLISFVGIYVQKYNKMENIIKDYQFTKDLCGYRQIMFEISDAKQVLDEDGNVVGNTDNYDEETIKSNKYKKTKISVNKKEDLKQENYEISKVIIEKRLNSMGINDYNLSLDKENGKIYLQIPEDSNTDRVVSNIIETGSFEIKDSEEGTIYVTGENLKKVSAMYNTTEDGTTVYLDIRLDKQGTETLKEISTNQYVTIEEEVLPEEDKEKDSEKKESKESKQKEVVLSISGNNMITTSFDAPILDGVIDLSMNTPTTDNNEINETLKKTSTIVALLESGELPLVYKVTENQYVTTDISTTFVRNAIIVVGTIFAVLLVFMIIKHKLNGLIRAICMIGFIATYLLLIRYTNVAISISGAIAIAIICIINYIFNMKLLSTNKQDKKLYKHEYIRFIMNMIPLLIISIVFIFMKWIALSSFGMAMFWGIILMIIYNILITEKTLN